MTNVNPSAPINVATANIVGTVSGSTYKISSYEHYSGLVQAATANTITLTIDVSGAGDTFTAAFIVKYFQTKDIPLSIKFANEKSSDVVSKRGVVTPE